MARAVIASTEEQRLLQVLHQVIEGRKGWRWARVRGWVLGSEINDLADSSVATQYLHRLRAAGMVGSVTVPDPGRPGRGPVLWRLTQQGENALAEREWRRPIRISKPARSADADRGVIFLSRDAWAALSVLQTHGGCWLSSPDLIAEAARRYAVAIYADDMQMLLKRRLAERHPVSRGRKPVLHYRATGPGLGVTLVDGITNPEIVQVRLPPEEVGA